MPVKCLLINRTAQLTWIIIKCGGQHSIFILKSYLVQVQPYYHVDERDPSEVSRWKNICHSVHTPATLFEKVCMQKKKYSINAKTFRNNSMLGEFDKLKCCSHPLARPVCAGGQTTLCCWRTCCHMWDRLQVSPECGCACVLSNDT